MMNKISLVIFSKFCVLLLAGCDILTTDLSELANSRNPATNEAVAEVIEDELESIFLGHPIFIAHDRTDYDEFEHVIFSADAVTDQDIINWFKVYFQERAQLDSTLAIINLDNQTQLAIRIESSRYVQFDRMLISYRHLMSNAPYQDNDMWWDIALGRFALGLADEGIRWEGFVESRFAEGVYVIRALSDSPLN